jgi:NAD(P)-dependent dehydrogenase (short-subunit alcohol dehydrogenase family)
MGVSFDLTDRVTVITGASRGIGESIARTFAENGARVVLASRKQEGLDKVAASINDAGGEALPIACNTGYVEQIDQLFAKVKDAYGKADVLVNSAATNPYFGDCMNISESQFDKTVDVNFKGCFFMAARAGKMMLEQKKGAIINVASIGGIIGPPMQGVYGMTKAAVILMTKVYAKEYGPFGIRCNAICPGLVETYMSKVLFETKPIYEAVLSQIPLKRHAQPDEMAGIALYLASDASSFTTGGVFVVDGGTTA